MILAAVLLVAQTLAQGVAPTFDHVLVVSIDGLRPDAIDPRPIGATPALARMLRGPGTLNARTDPDSTVTLPNHLGMVTGLLTELPSGHGWRANDDRFFVRGHQTVHSQAKRYVPSMFDVAHDEGLSTGVFASKRKFWLLTLSYDDESGAEDARAPDFGKRKLDVFVYAPVANDLAAQVVAWLTARTSRSLALVHFSDPDVAGHTSGWVLEPQSPYLTAVARADAALGTLMSAVEASPSLRGRTAFIVTTDHGGGDPLLSHTVARSACNFRIPFLVWLGADGEPRDLARLNADRRAVPAIHAQVDQLDHPQPIRNADAANLALQLLGLPPVPGSTCNPKHDLILHAASAPGAAPVPAPAPAVGHTTP